MSREQPSPSAWFVRAGREGKWRQRFLDTGNVYIGYGMQSLPKPTSDDDISAELLRVRPEKSTKGRVWQVRYFVNEMAPGQLILSDLYDDRYGYGEIAGDWFVDEQQEDGRICRPVRWLGTVAHSEVPDATNTRIRSQGTLKLLYDEHLVGVRTLEAAREVVAFREGRTLSVMVTRRERDPAARAACLAHHKSICAACGVDLRAKYSGVSRDFMHIHHLNPLGDSVGEHAVDPIVDLRPLCPTCHGAAHTKSPPFSIDELRAMLR